MFLLRLYVCVWVCSFDNLNAHMTSPDSLHRQPEPCSRESVLSVLRESRKREVDKEDKRENTEGQYGKRRYITVKEVVCVSYSERTYKAILFLCSFLWCLQFSNSVLFCISRHDSGGSANSGLESLLANGAPSLHVPK